MLDNINKLIEEAKKTKLKPKYMVVSYKTSKLIPYKTDEIGQDIYKGLVMQIWPTCPDDKIYFHHYKPI